MRIRLAIIGASYLQAPLIRKAKSLGIETHVFAWGVGDAGEAEADCFYPISIVEHDAILEVCRSAGVDGVCTIASDLASVTVGFVSCALGLPGNSAECVAMTTNKHLMRAAFARGCDPSPKSIQVMSVQELVNIDLDYPLIVKPADRSGSRGITKLDSPEDLRGAYMRAYSESFSKAVLVEEFVRGREFSVESISWQGQHQILAITEKFTTGAPRFIERAHLEPARVSSLLFKKISNVVMHALDSLEVEYGASHAEVKVDENEAVRIIEIGARMGGGLIGSHLVQMSTGYDYLKAVIDVALGKEPQEVNAVHQRFAAVRFFIDESDEDSYRMMLNDNPEMIIACEKFNRKSNEVVDSSTRGGYYLFASRDEGEVLRFLPA